ncbi:hypothetical protein HHL16_18130 [Pseudoflavitalea sp. G-6-1-2]|uniref:hypothetical protein n=1 Tax=Pseudoflavitalea sp. G-6-1-2 TaxID=2728841 RepID=UPI00146EF811|nr:hypothetical protein [Pseudoflavitalea sp. G-6-1-2]NML22809.1 hypothetical protein [Pseudoflavitalea sp. G-6-1-2]
MKRSIILLTALTALTGILFVSCNKKDDFKSDSISDYFITTPGKFIRYRLDSLRFTEFGQGEITVSYEAKDVVDGPIDVLGANSHRIIRYYRPWGSTNEADWLPQIAYSVSLSFDQVKVLEDNLTYVKMKLPIKFGTNWLGNAFLPVHPLAPRYQFSNDGDMREWEYNYDEVGESVTVGDKSYENTVTIHHVADSQNAPITQPDLIGYRNYSSEIYAKGIGLVYKDFRMWEYQPKNGDKEPYKTGFGIQLTAIDHN